VKSQTLKQISVVLVEDHRMFREQLAHLIDKADDMKVCGQTDNIRDGLALIKETQPSIAIIDVTLRGSSGLELLKDLRAQGIDLPTLILSMHDESVYAERALRAGAKGYVTKNEASTAVLQAIRQIVKGEIYLNPCFMTRMVRRITGDRDIATEPIDRLADRELEVFDMIGRGLTTREIAERLGLGVTTVDTYKSRIREKLNLENSARLRFAASRWVFGG